MKLLNQSLVACYVEAVAETYDLARKFGIAKTDMFNVISASWGDSPVFRHFIKVMSTKKFRGGATIKTIDKDVSIILRNADKIGAKMALLRLVHRQFSHALSRGFGGMDAAVLFMTL